MTKKIDGKKKFSYNDNLSLPNDGHI